MHSLVNRECMKGYDFATELETIGSGRNGRFAYKVRGKEYTAFADGMSLSREFVPMIIDFPL